MGTEHQPAARNGSRNAIGINNSRLTCDGKTRVFNATADEIDELIAMLNAVHLESPALSADPFSRPQAIRVVSNLLGRDDTFAVIAYKDGEAVGCMGGILTPQLTSDMVIASEMLLYVEPEHRGSRAALYMLRAFEQWARPYDMRVGSSLAIDDERAVKFYERLGYKQSGVSLTKVR